MMNTVTENKINNGITLKLMGKDIMADSLEVAENFRKRHDNILRDIDNLRQNIECLLKFEETPGRFDNLNVSSDIFTDVFGGKSDNKGQHNFVQTPKSNRNSAFCKDMFVECFDSVDSQGKPRRTYLMNRDGFSLLVMGFTGKKALEWKLKYIQAFNAMENTLKNTMQQGAANNTDLLAAIIETNKLAVETISLLRDIVLKHEHTPQTTSPSTPVATAPSSHPVHMQSQNMTSVRYGVRDVMRATGRKQIYVMGWLQEKGYMTRDKYNHLVPSEAYRNTDLFCKKHYPLSRGGYVTNYYISQKGLEKFASEIGEGR